MHALTMSYDPQFLKHLFFNRYLSFFLWQFLIAWEIEFEGLSRVYYNYTTNY